MQIPGLHPQRFWSWWPLDHTWRNTTPRRPCARGPQEQNSLCCSTHTRDSKALIDIPQRRHSCFKLGRMEAGWGLEISQRVLCEITTAYFAVEPQQHLIKKRSVGPLELIRNYFCQCHTQNCVWGSLQAHMLNWKALGFENKQIINKWIYNKMKEEENHTLIWERRNHKRKENSVSMWCVCLASNL